MVVNRDAPMLVLLTAVVGIGLFAAGRGASPSSDAKPDITGRWELNLQKSRFGKMPQPVSMSLVATKRGGTLHSVQTTYDQSGGPNAIEGDWYLDGKDRSLGSDGKMTSVSKWEGDTLFSERKSKDGSYDETIRLHLTEGGKVAVEEIRLKSPNGNNTSTLVWDRK